MSDPIAVDSSVLIAILNREAETQMFLEALDRSRAIVGWPTIFESRIWTLRRNERQHSQWLDHWLDGGTVLTVPFDGELERFAAAAYDRFGKGRHPAALNFGDCMAYAVAQHHEVPLLFKGSDFAKTDLKVHEASVVTA